MRRVFKALKRADIARGNLVLAWDFTVASRESTTGPMLHMRDTAFAALGDTDLADLEPEGRSPAFTVVKNESTPPEDTEIARVVEGTIAVPCFLENAGCAVGARLHRDADGRPAQKPGNVYTAFYRCVIPRGLPAGGGRALIYGHGLLGRPLDSGDSAQGQLKTLAAQKGFTVCGTYWSGLSAANGDEDTLQAAAAIQDLSRFGAITDRLQQGMLNHLFLGRAMVAADGLRSHPAFAGAFDATAAPLLRRQLAGRDQRRRAHRGRARLRPRGARRAGHELLDAAVALGRLHAVPRRCSTRPTPTRSTAR